MAAFDYLTILALLVAIGSTALHLQTDSFLQVCKRVRDCEAELAEVADRTSNWMKRDSVRQAREKKAEQSESDPNGNVAIQNKKAQIRARALHRMQ